MTTAAGEYTPLPLRSQFAALAIAADHPELHPSFALPSPSSSSSPQEDLPGEAANAGGGPAAAAAAPPRKAWGSPPRRVPEQGEVAFMEELGSSWPVPSRGGPSSRKRHPQQNLQEGPLGTPLAASTAAAVMAPSDSAQQPDSGGDPIARSAATSLPVDPQQKQQKGKEEGAWGTEMRTKANNNAKSHRPLLRPRQHQARPPMQNGHKGRNQQHFLGNGGNHQQQRLRHQRNAGFFPQHQPAQVIGDYGYQSVMMGLLNPASDWGINPSSNLQWGPNLQTTPARMNTPAPPENLFLRGYFPGPFSPDGISYCAAPFAPMVRPPLGQNPPWFMAPLPPLAAPTLPHQHANPPLPPDDHQLPPGIAQQEAEDVAARLRKQIEYYFSDQNLVKDVYLRTCMDEEGWISVHTIANFPRVQSLTRDEGLIVVALQSSPTVEVSVDKMRRKGEWGRWIIQRQPPLGCQPWRAPEG